MRKSDRNKLRVLRALQKGAIAATLKIKGEPYFDDHIMCVDVRVHLDPDTWESEEADPGTITLALLWCGWEIVAACEYFEDSQKARNLWHKHMVDAIGEYAEDEEGDSDLLSAFKGF